MKKIWKDIALEIDTLCEEIITFIEREGLSSSVRKLNGDFQIHVSHRNLGVVATISIKYDEKSRVLHVDFRGSELYNQQNKLGFIALHFGGGLFLLRSAKAYELSHSLETKFWPFLEEFLDKKRKK